MIKDIVSKAIDELRTKLNEAILNRDFVRIKEGKHTITIEALGETVEIWNVDDQPCSLYSVDVEEDSISCPFINFKKPITCRKILRDKTKEEEDKHNSEIDKQIKELYDLKS